MRTLSAATLRPLAKTATIATMNQSLVRSRFIFAFTRAGESQSRSDGPEVRQVRAT
jgi:hypothetical protein